MIKIKIVINLNKIINKNSKMLIKTRNSINKIMLNSLKKLKNNDTINYYIKFIIFNIKLI